MTSNLNPKEFKDLMGERIWDRLAERVFSLHYRTPRASGSRKETDTSIGFERSDHVGIV